MAKKEKGKGKGKVEEKTPGKRGNAENLQPKEKVMIPKDLLAKIKKNRPDVFKLIEDLTAARDAGDDTAQRKARMALRKAGFYLSKLEAGEDPFLTEEEAKERTGKKKEKKSKKEEVETEEEEGEEEEEEGSEEDDLDEMDRDELKEYISENDLDIKVTKKMSDDDIREAIREAVGEEGTEEEVEEEVEEEDD